MSGGTDDYKNYSLSGNLGKDIALFKIIFKRDAVFRIREVLIGASAAKCCLFYMDGMVNSSQLGETVVEALIECRLYENSVPSAEDIAQNILFANEVTETEKIPDLLRAILYGDTVLIVQNSRSALCINT